MKPPFHVLNLPHEARMLDVVRAGLANSREACFAISFVRCSGLQLLVDPLREFAARGGRARVLTSTYMSVTQPEALESLYRLPRVQTRVQRGDVGFHSKYFWFGRETESECWIGSSNLTKGGLSANIEWNLRTTDASAAEAGRAAFESLWARPDVTDLDSALIEDYRQTYEGAQSVGRSTPASGDALRPNAAQREALASLAEIRARGQRRAVVVAATGVGKTHLAAFDFLASGARSGLFVSHRLEHLLQAKRAFRQVVGPKCSLGIVADRTDEVAADMVFATVQTVARRPELLSRLFDYLIIDEFHHAEAPSYARLKPVADQAFLLGLTATPERTDGRDVLAWCDWNIAYEVRLAEAIDRGWLLPFHYFGIADDSLDFARVAWRNAELLQDALSLEKRAQLVLREARAHGFDGPKRATIGFCAGVRHACFMADAFKRLGETAVAVWGAQRVEEREVIYNQLADPNHALQWVFVPDILNEGVDIPAVNSILFLRPTESATIFLQQLGRGLRLTPGCEVLTVLDFVGHHQSAWLTLNSLHMPGGGGRRTEITSGNVIVPPAGCEIVLQRRTQEILAKVRRFTTRREACDEAYDRLRADLDRPLMPLDLWGREDVPEFKDFRAQGTWLEVQRSHKDAPAWSVGLTADHPAATFLSALESDWQAQRVGPYALAWALAEGAKSPDIARFFERFPQWACETGDPKAAWATLRRKLSADVLDDGCLVAAVRQRVGHELLWEVEARILLTVNKDFQERHGGVLRRPEDLHLWAQYQRPEIVRYFGAHYDPTKHNLGVVWFGADCVIIAKLDTSGALESFQYANSFVDAATFSWTSQNRQSPDNEAGRKLVEHEARGLRLHLFVQARSHVPAHYLGQIRVAAFEGQSPMNVRFALLSPVPADVLTELAPKFEPGEESAPGPTLAAAKRGSVSPPRSNVSPFRRLPVRAARPYANCIPLYANLRIAAGAFGDECVVDEDADSAEVTGSRRVEWVTLPRPFRPGRDLFLARVEGESMNRVIPNGAFCLWQLSRSDVDDGVIVLAEHRDIVDAEFGGQYTVKRFHREHATEIRLSPDSRDPSFQSIVIRRSDDAGFRIIATLVRVLDPAE